MILYPEKDERWPDWSLSLEPRMRYTSDPWPNTIAWWDSEADEWAQPWPSYEGLKLSTDEYDQFMEACAAYNRWQRWIGNKVYKWSYSCLLL